MKEKTTMIRTTIVSSDDGRNTYEIRKELLDAEGKPIKGDKALLIGMYPTVTADDGYKLDMTTLHILSKMEELGLCSVRIVNLFSKVCNARLSAKGLEVDKANFEYMESVMNEKDFPSHKVIIAWGNSMTTSKACNHSKALFIKLFPNTMGMETFIKSLRHTLTANDRKRPMSFTWAYAINPNLGIWSNMRSLKSPSYHRNLQKRKTKKRRSESMRKKRLQQKINQN